MPGIITAVYLSSGEGRKGDESLGDQDEIDMEWKGNDAYAAQSNVFFDGQESLETFNLGGDTSQAEHMYAVEWDDSHVAFFVDGAQCRYVQLFRPLKPMKLHLSLWTTSNGWPGLIQWGGATEWGARGHEPIDVTFELTSFPQ